MAERQCTSVTIGWTLAVARATSSWVLFSSRAGRLVERARCAGNRDHRPARSHQLRAAGCACASRATEHAASVGRASGRHLQHHSRWTGSAATQQRELPRRRAPYHRRWCAGGSAGVCGNRPSSSATGTRAHP